MSAPLRTWHNGPVAALRLRVNDARPETGVAEKFKAFDHAKKSHLDDAALRRLAARKDRGERHVAEDQGGDDGPHSP